MKTDVTLRSLLARGAPALIRMLTGAEVACALPTEFPEARDQRVDTLLRLRDGRILHIEWQAGPDPRMPWRMLRYWVTITNVYPDDPLEQVVIQVGGDRLVPDRLERPPLSFGYKVIDSRDLDPAPLLASPAIEDNILAILCGREGLTDRVRAILYRIGRLEPEARRHAVTQLLMLAGLRRVSNLVLEEGNRMPLNVYDTSDPFLVSLISKGRIEGLADGKMEGLADGKAWALVRLLERRFGPLSEERRAQIGGASPDIVEHWFDLSLDAATLEEVLGPSPVN